MSIASITHYQPFLNFASLIAQRRLACKKLFTHVWQAPGVLIWHADHVNGYVSLGACVLAFYCHAYIHKSSHHTKTYPWIASPMMLLHIFCKSLSAIGSFSSRIFFPAVAWSPSPKRTRTSLTLRSFSSLPRINQNFARNKHIKWIKT